MPADLKPTEAMAAEAARGLAWRDEFKRGGTLIGVARARDISNRKNLSPETIRRMVSYFARHEVDKQGEGFSPGEPGYPSAGRIAWALWGGDPGQSWANARSKELERNESMQILSIENKAGKVRLNEGVYSESVERLIEEIDMVFGATAASNGADFGAITNSIENAADTLDIEIHSPGGSVLDGYKLYHSLMELRERGVYVTATINTLAASMASVVAMAADKIRMVTGGQMMIHEVSGGMSGNAEQMASYAKLIDGMSQEIAEIYAGRTKKTPDEMRDLMRKETWMGAKVALEEGFIDEVIDRKFDTPAKNMSLLERLTSPSNAEALSKIEALENAAQAHESIVAEIEGKLSVAANALQEAATELTEAKASLESSEAKVVELEAFKAEAEAKLAELAEAAIKTDEKVALEAARLLAATGSPDPVDNPENGSDASKELTREEFRNLSPIARQTFLRAGGKLI